MASKEEKRAPELFGPYEVYERIGVGGMATVHRAKKQGIEGFERVVALKRMLSHLADDETFIKSFVREARLASQLQHGNIIQIYDLGRVGRVYYIAMEHVRGRDLRKILKQTAYATGPVPLAMMLSIARQLCDALDYAHNLADENGEALGIVHRDISPSNLLVAADGHLKIIDFGIAKATASSLRTLSGRVKGKFSYMSPEAIQGQQLDRRTDIFAVGIVAHEMLTARPLFATKNQFDTIRKVTQEDVPPPSYYNPECPPELDDIVMTALAKSPDERWQTAGAMHRALDHVAKRRGLQASNREIAEWVEWAFEQPLQSRRVDPSNKPVKRGKEPTLKSSGPVVPVEKLDSASIELVWGARGSGRNARSSAPVAPIEADDSRGSQPVPVQSASDSQSAPVPQPRGAPDRSQPYPRVPSAHVTAPAAPRATADAGSQPVVAAAARQTAGQSTMLGVAPPPGQTWRAQNVTPAETEAARPVAASGARPRLRELPRPRPPGGEGTTGRTVLHIALVLVLCVAAAVGGYFAVLALFGS